VRSVQQNHLSLNRIQEILKEWLIIVGFSESNGFSSDGIVPSFFCRRSKEEIDRFLNSSVERAFENRAVSYHVFPITQKPQGPMKQIRENRTSHGFQREKHRTGCLKDGFGLSAKENQRTAIVSFSNPEKSRIHTMNPCRCCARTFIQKPFLSEFSDGAVFFGKSSS